METSLDRSGAYDQTALDLINQAKILDEKDLTVITDLREELLENFQTSQIFRTRTEMDVSVLNNLHFPTPDSKFWQAQREQNVHFHELVMLSYEYRKNLVEIRKLKRKLAAETDPDERELLEIEVDKLTFIARNQERVAKDRIREVKEWHEIKARLLPSLEYGTQDCGKHQLVSYTKRWIQEWMAMGPGGSPAERQNLLGQLSAGISACIAHGLIREVLAAFPPQVTQKIEREYGLKLPRAN